MVFFHRCRVVPLEHLQRVGGKKIRKLCILDTVSQDEPTLKIVAVYIFSNTEVWISWSSSLLASFQSIWQLGLEVFQRLNLVQFHRKLDVRIDNTEKYHP